MLKDKVIGLYKGILFRRFDGDRFTFYFSEKDFLGLKTKKYEFKRGENTLRGKFYYYEGYKPNHIVIFEHGLGAGHNAYMREIERIAQEGYLVYSYDRTGCMESDGVGATGCLTSIADLDACLKALKKDYPNYSFSVIGHSWGGFSTSSVALYHPDVLHLVAISGFVSPNEFLNQFFPKFLKKIKNEVLKLEEEANREYISTSAIDALKGYKGHALIIHSKDDNIVSFKNNFKLLKDKIAKSDNISFLELKKKKHFPHYSDEAIIELSRFIKEKKKISKKKDVTSEEIKAFIDSFDWYLMTKQDEAIWNEIFETLKK